MSRTHRKERVEPTEDYNRFEQGYRPRLELDSRDDYYPEEDDWYSEEDRLEDWWFDRLLPPWAREPGQLSRNYL